MMVSLGEALIDLIHGPDDESPQARVGGSPYNVAIALSRLEVAVGLVCPLSTDPYGDLLAEGLRSHNVPPLVQKRVDAPTALAEVFTDPSGHPRYSFHRDGTADRALSACPPVDALPPELDALHFGSLVLAQGSDWPAWRAAVVAARERGAFIAFDPNLRVPLIDDMDAYRVRLAEAVALADLVKASDEDLAALSPGHAPEEVLHRWRSSSRTLVLTEGARGAQVWTGSGAHAICRDTGGGPVVDTVGAGDTFQAALLAWLHHHSALKRALEADEAEELLTFAVRAAALNCAKPGCQPPALAEVL